MEINELFGLPAHPLLVHGAVVLVPLAALVLVLAALVPRMRRAGAPVALALSFVALVFVGLAQGSGEQLEERVVETELVEAHEEKGESVLPWAFGLTIVAGALSVVAFRSSKTPALASTGLAAVLAVASCGVAAGATYTVIDVGHSGAAAAWSDLPDAAPEGSGESEEHDEESDEDSDDGD